MDEPLERSQRTRRRARVVVALTVIISCLLFFGSLVSFVVLANAGRVDLVERIGVYVGLGGVVLGSVFIVYLLSRPPFSTGEVLKTLRAVKTPRLGRDSLSR